MYRGRKRVRGFVDYLPADESVYVTLVDDTFELSLRRLAKVGGGARFEESKPRLSGGVRADITVPGCSYDPEPVELMKRLGPGWTPEQFEQRVTTLIEQAHKTYRLRLRRDALYHRIVAIRNYAAFEAAMYQQSVLTGHTVYIEDMDLADLEYWDEWLTIQGL